MRRVLIGLPAAALGLLLTACGDPNAPANSPTAPLPAPSTTSPVPLPATPPVAARQVVVEGVVEAGVEPGCKVLNTKAGQYLLLGDVPLGVEVRITGVRAPGVSTTCQQGTPLRVTKVQRK